MMLDLQDAWDDLVLRLTGDQATATRILGNRFYQQLSRELPGAQEFIACESLYTLAESAEYDLIVLDTPPTQNALDFLNAPDRILGFLKTDGFQNFLTQKNGWVNRAGLQFLDVAGLAVQRLLAHFTGGAFLEELSEFMVLMKDLYQPISERTEGFKDILASKDSSFFIVTAPHPTSLNECQFFAEELHRRNFPVSAVIGNQLIPPTKLENIQRVPESLRFHLSRLRFREGEIDVLIPALLQSEIEQHSQWKTEQHHFNELRETLGQELRFFAVPDFVDNPHNIEGLARMVPYFMGPAAQRVPK